MRGLRVSDTEIPRERAFVAITRIRRARGSAGGHHRGFARFAFVTRVIARGETVAHAVDARLRLWIQRTHRLTRLIAAHLWTRVVRALGGVSVGWTVLCDGRHGQQGQHQQHPTHWGNKKAGYHVSANSYALYSLAKESCETTFLCRWRGGGRIEVIHHEIEEHSLLFLHVFRHHGVCGVEHTRHERGNV